MKRPTKLQTTEPPFFQLKVGLKVWHANHYTNMPNNWYNNLKTTTGKPPMDLSPLVILLVTLHINTEISQAACLQTLSALTLGLAGTDGCWLLELLFDLAVDIGVTVATGLPVIAIWPGAWLRGLLLDTAATLFSSIATGAARELASVAASVVSTFFSFALGSSWKKHFTSFRLALLFTHSDYW